MDRKVGGVGGGRAPEPEKLNKKQHIPKKKVPLPGGTVLSGMQALGGGRVNARPSVSESISQISEAFACLEKDRRHDEGVDGLLDFLDSLRNNITHKLKDFKVVFDDDEMHECHGDHAELLLEKLQTKNPNVIVHASRNILLVNPQTKSEQVDKVKAKVVKQRPNCPPPKATVISQKQWQTFIKILKPLLVKYVEEIIKKRESQEGSKVQDESPTHQGHTQRKEEENEAIQEEKVPLSEELEKEHVDFKVQEKESQARKERKEKEALEKSKEEKRDIRSQLRKEMDKS